MLQKVVRSTIIDAPIERVWALIRDFNSHDQWHDVVDTSAIEGGQRSDRVGCVRSFSLKDGNRIREQLLTLDDRGHKSTYCIVEATVPLQRYVATVTLRRVTDGDRTFWHWESTFATPPGRERELREMVAKGVYEAGFENLRRHLARGGDLRAAGAAAGAGSGASSTPLPRALPLPARRVSLRAYGGPEVLQAEDGELPAPGPGQVRIRQRAVGVNFFDVYLRRGWLPELLPLPGTPGQEAAGTVLDVGEGVHGLVAGDRVAYLSPEPGAYATLRCVGARHVVRLPAAVEDETAAALLLKGITADVLIRDVGRIGPGTRLLVHAAAGGVGSVLCAWASRLGARVVGTVSSEAKARIARDHGCEAVIVVGADGRFAEAVHQAFAAGGGAGAGSGAEVIVDGLGDVAHDQNLAALAPCGHWISLGQAGGLLRPISPQALAAKSATFSRPVVFAHVATPEALRERAERVWRALASGAIRMPEVERHPLEAAARAHERLESRRTTGPLVLLA